MIKGHLLVNFAQESDARRCLAAAKGRFPDLPFRVDDNSGLFAVKVEMPSAGLMSLPRDHRTYDLVQQFCAGYWYAVRDRG